MNVVTWERHECASHGQDFVIELSVETGRQCGPDIPLQNRRRGTNDMFEETGEADQQAPQPNPAVSDVKIYGQ
jgi:hypothetical protein